MNTYRDMHGEEYDVQTALCESALVHVNRNSIFRYALEQDADHLVFIDADMVWEPDDVRRMIELDKDVVCGVYPTRKNGIRPLVCQKTDDGRYKPIQTMPGEPFRCAAGATGFMCIRRNVLAGMSDGAVEVGYPFDYLENTQDYDDAMDTKFLGEDISFCKRLEMMDFELWCHPQVTVGHTTLRMLKLRAV